MVVNWVWLVECDVYIKWCEILFIYFWIYIYMVFIEVRNDDELWVIVFIKLIIKVSREICVCLEEKY